MQISGSVALVTGGASGLGAATARRLALGGAHVVVLDRGPTASAEGDNHRGSSSITVVQGDVTDELDVQAAVDVAARLGELRIVVNAAGIGIAPARTVGRDGTPHDLSEFRR